MNTRLPSSSDPLRRTTVVAIAVLLTAPLGWSASSNWNVDANGNWSTAGSWDVNGIPGATTGTTSTDVATFGFPLTADRTVTVDTSRNIGGITLSNTSGFRYVLSGGSILLSNGGLIQTTAGNGDHTDTISSAITIQGDGGAAMFTAGASSANSLLSINTVTGVSTGSNVTTLTLNGTNTGANSVIGVIGNGAGGGKLAVVKSDAGNWLLSGANTFTGGLTIKAGTLTSTVNNGLGGSGTGAVTLGDVSGTNSATLIVGNSLTIGNAITLGGTTGTLTIGRTSGNAVTSFTGGVTGINNLTVDSTNALNGGTSFTNSALNIAGIFTNIGTGLGTTTISGGVGSNVTGIIQNSATSALTISNTALTVNSAGTTLTNSGGKILTLSAATTGTGNLIIKNNSSLGSGITVSGAVNHTGTITNSGTGTTPVTVSTGTSNSLEVGVNISGVIGSNVSTVTQNSATTPLMLSAANTFTGNATILSGSLVLAHATAASSSQILLGDTTGPATNASLLLRGVSIGGTVANNVLVRAGNSGTATIGSSQGGSGGSTGATIMSGLITLDKSVILSPYNVNLTFTPTGGTSFTGVGGINVVNGGLFTNSNGQTWGVGGASAILTSANTYQGDTKVLSGSLQLSGPGTGTGNLISWLGTSTNDVFVGDTSGYQSARLAFAPGAANQTFSRNVTIQAGSGGLGTVGVTTSSFTMNGNITLNKSGTLFTARNATSTFAGNLVKGAGTTGAVSITQSGQGVTQLTGTGNNYDGGTVLGGSGVLVASGAGSLGSGNVIAELGNLRLSTQTALASGKTVYVGPYGGLSIGSNTAGFATYLAGILDSTSSGGITLGTGLSNNNALTLSDFGNGYMYLGADASSAYSASTLGANSDGNYRLGFGGNTLTISTNVLVGNSAKLIVGVPGNSSAGSGLNTVGTVSLTGINTYGGGTEVNTGSTLLGTQRTVVGDSPFGSATGAMTLHHATVRLQNSTTSSVVTNVGAFSFDGQSTVQVDGVTGGANTLTLASLTRNGNGVLNIATSGTGAVLGSTAFLKIAGAASTAVNAKVSGGVGVGMVAPYIVDSSSGNFMTYDATNGFTAITNAYTTFAGTPTDGIVKLGTGATLNADTTVYALSTGSIASSIAITGSGGDRTLTISSGGLYHGPGSSSTLTIGSGTAGQKVNLNFGGKEAVITATTTNNSTLTIANNITNATGITKSGNSALILSGTGSDFVGPITIFNGGTNGCVSISNDLNLGGVGLALNNGVVLDGGKLQFNGFTGNLSSTRTITIGANGGILQTLNGGNVSSSAITIDSKITGATGGYLNLYSGSTGSSSITVTSSFTFTNAANDFVAPIFIGNTNAQGIMTLIFDTDSQLGNAANTVSLIGGNSALRYNGTGAITTSRGINFLDQGGGVDIADANGTLTASGILAGSGLFNKMGTGKMVLTGANTYTGNTIVSAGVLNVQNANALGATTAVIAGNSGVSGGGVFVQDGAALELQGDIAVAGSGGKTMYLNGSGISSGGALRNVSGANSNTGAVILQSASTVGVDAGSLTLSGTVSGSSLTKTGSGTLVLSGANTYSGGTTVSFGKLLVNNSTGSGTGSGALSIGASATLGGSGFINSVTSIAGTLSPGNSPGILAFNNDVTLLTGSSTNIEINGASTRGTDYDGINFNAGLSIVGGTLTFNISTAIADSSVVNIFDGAALTPTFTSIVASGTGGYSGSFLLDAGNTSYSATFGTQNLVFDLNAGTLTFNGTGSIPEPATFAAIFAATALGFAGLRRRRHES